LLSLRPSSRNLFIESLGDEFADMLLPRLRGAGHPLFFHSRE